MPDLSHFRQDSLPPYRLRVYREDFGSLDPLALPWKDMRRHPERFPDVHMAKIQSARTVAGLWYQPPSGERIGIYLKRSFIRGRLRRLLAPFRQTKEWREFLLAQQFMSAGFHVPEPLYYSEAVQPDGERVTFYATLALAPEYKDAKSFFLEQRRFEDEWQDLAAFTRSLHEKGVLHADYRASHLFISGQGLGRKWALIDLDGSRVGRPVKGHDRVRAVRQLAESLLKAGLTEEHLREFLAVYDPENRYPMDTGGMLEAARRKAAGR